MRQSFKKTFSFTAVLALVYVLGSMYFDSSLAAGFGHKVLDGLVLADRQFIKRTAADPVPVVVITVDQDSLSRMNLRWPWSRQIWAEFLDRLQRHKPRVVVFDYFFTGQSSEPAADEALAAAMQKYDKVVIGLLFDEQQKYAEPYAGFKIKNVSLGALNLPVDEDVRIRRSFTVLQAGEKLIPSLGLAAALADWDLSGAPLSRAPVRSHGLWMEYPVLASSPEKPRKIYSSCADLTRILDFSFKIKHIPLWKIMLEDEIIPELEGKVVFVGDGANILKDQHRTPAGEKSGVTIHALSAADILLDRQFIVASPLIPVALFLLMSLAVGLMLAFRSRRQGIISALVFSMILVAAAQGLWSYGRVFLDISFPIAGILLSLFLYVLKGDIEDYVKLRLFKRKAAQDPLTGLLNVESFKASVESVLSARRTGREFPVLIFYDIDHFKKINDTFGHDRGNEVIQTFASVLRQAVRHQDPICRFGGDEFCVLLLVRDAGEAALFMERVNRSLAEIQSAQPELPAFQTSAGAALVKSGMDRFEPLLRAADRALYQSKEEGRNRFKITEI